MRKRLVTELAVLSGDIQKAKTPKTKQTLAEKQTTKEMEILYIRRKRGMPKV